MKKIKCPNCGSEIKPSRGAYDHILKQVRDQEFFAELEAFRTIVEQEKEAAIKEAKLQAESEAKNIISELSKNLSRMESRLSHVTYENKYQIQEIQSLYETRLREKDEQIAQLNNFRARLSTKMVGESLEQHCESMFNAIRTTAFPNAKFGKDNDVTQGSKGDYIYREFDESGVEILSIMFEMKNESDATPTKRKNEDFFKELDKDRKQKKCEYAVLVSMLELDNELYNAGIVDVSYKYPKMYVVRPQSFIAIITILRNAAMSTIAYKKELALAKSKQVDIAALEADIDDFKGSFGRNYKIANDRMDKAINDIDRVINILQKIKEELLSSGNQLRMANDKAQSLTVQKLTKAKTRKSRSNK